MDLRFSLVGLIIGFLIGLTGMGGGALLTPIMILIMGVKPAIAVGTDLAYGFITRLFGAGVHWRQGTVHRKSAYLLGAGSIPSSILGVGLFTAVKKSHPALVNLWLLHTIAWVLILVAGVLVAKPLLQRAAQHMRPNAIDPRDAIVALGDRKPWILPIVGAVVGFLVGVTSVGAGTLIIVSLLFLYPRWEAKDLVGTDVFHAGMLVGAASLAHLAAGNVNVSMMLSLLVGSIPGVMLGSRLTIGFPEPVLRFSLASIMVLSGSSLL